MRLELQANMQEIPRLTHAAEDFCRAAQLDPAIEFAVKLALEELFCNLVRHGFPNRTPGPIAVELELQPSQLVVRMHDDAVPFDPRQGPTPSWDQCPTVRPAGGLGLHFVRQLIDEIDYHSEAGRNTLTLRKRLTNTAAGAPEPSARCSHSGAGMFALFEKINDVLVVEMSGQLDASNVDEVGDKLLDMIAGGLRQVVIDCGKLKWMSSAGIRLLILLVKELKPKNGELLLANPTEEVKAVLKMGGIAAMFPTFATRADALAHFAAA